MDYIDDRWAPLSVAANVAGTSEDEIVARLTAGDLRGYQDSRGRIFVHKDEFIRLRDENDARQRAVHLMRIMGDACFESPVDQQAHEARLRSQERGGRR
jgi:hypothetical protein